MMNRFLISSYFVALGCIATMVQAENWPQWRGPRADGTTEEKGLPLEWSAETNIAWKTKIPGEGHSSPIIWEKRVFLTTAMDDGHDRALLCINAESGEVLWSKTAVRTEIVESHHQQNNFASSTAATDGERVFTSFLANDRMTVNAFDFEGNIVWTSTPLAYSGEHGYNHTPILHKGLLIFDVSQLKEAAILALDAKTGKVRWKVETDNETCSNVPPYIFESEGRARLFTSGNNVVRELDPLTGKVQWSVAGPTKYCVAGFAHGDGILLASGGWPTRQAHAISLSNGAASIAWTQTKASTYVPSPVFVDGHFYVINDNGITTCLSAKTGEAAWQERIPGNYRASLILAEGRIYVTNDEGITTVFEASSAGFKKLAENRLDEFIYTTPSPSGGRFFIRTGEHLFCIGEK